MLRSKRGRILGEFSETMPRVKTRGELFAMERGAQQVSLEREVLPNHALRHSVKVFHVPVWRVAHRGPASWS